MLSNESSSLPLKASLRIGGSVFVAFLLIAQVALFPGRPLIDRYQASFSDYESHEIAAVNDGAASVAANASDETSHLPLAPTEQWPAASGQDLRRVNGGSDKSTASPTEANSTKADTSEKPILLIHIGPPKTATTTLQDGMKEMERQLLEGDRTFYCPFGSTRCNELAGKMRFWGVNGNLTASAESWNWGRHELQALTNHTRQTNFILSAEPLSIGYRWQHKLNRRAPLDWVSIKEQLGRDWHVVIVMGYRRYIDWLPSSEQQLKRWRRSKPKMNKWPDQGGQRIHPLLPNTWKSAIQPQKYDYTHTSHLVESINGTLPVVLFNMHDLSDMFLTASSEQKANLPSNDKVSLMSRFLCRTLKEAGIKTNSTCIHSLRIDKERSEERISNPSQTIYYDVLSVAAHDKGLVPSSSARHQVAVSMEQFHTAHLNETLHDLPVVCPTKKEYEEFLNHSLAVEAQLLPEFYNTPLGKEGHIKDFWKNVAKKKYCWVDTDAVLEKEEWKEFLKTLTLPATMQKAQTAPPAPPNTTSPVRGLAKAAIGGLDANHPLSAYAMRHNASKALKPLLLLHIGPPKTATTTLQHGLSGIRNQLVQDDNIYYCPGGEVCGNIASHIRTCGLDPNFTASVECWDQTRQALQDLPRPSKDTHILMSSEPMSIGEGWQHHLDQRAPIDWLSAKEQLGKDWRVVIILGYRRYIDWLPSSDQQIWRWTPHKPTMNDWPDKRGIRMSPLLPSRWKKAVKPKKYLYTHTSLLVESINNTLPVVLFNMHDLHDLYASINVTASHSLPSNNKVSLLSRFLCKTLKEAGVETSKTCIKQLMADSVRKEDKIVNPSQTLFYDALAVAAYDKKLVPLGKRRRLVALSIEQFQTQKLNQTFHDFPVKCPRDLEYNKFLSFSLDVEAKLLPEFYNTSLGKDGHIDSFWDNVKKNKYCWINTDAVLEQEKWKQFFQTPSNFIVQNPMAKNAMRARNRKKQRKEEEIAA